jgi:hypothetical protein
LPISNEAEFGKLLATALERERQRHSLREETAAREAQKPTSFEVVREKRNEGETTS